MSDWLNLPELDLPAITELSKHGQWVNWKIKEKPGKKKFGKVPYDPRSGKMASVTDPKSWSSFDIVYQACQDSQMYAGVGFVLTGDDPFTGVDLDNCHDPDTGVLSDWAQVIVDKIDSYTEISPSGTGIRIFVRGIPNIPRNRRGDIEVYMQERFLTITGTHFKGTPEKINPHASRLNDIFGEEEGTTHTTTVANKDLQALIDELTPQLTAELEAPKSKMGILWENVPAAHEVWKQERGDFTSQSEWDLSMCNYFMGAAWTPAEMMAGLIEYRERSGAGDDKLDRVDYFARTIVAARRGREDDVARNNLTTEALELLDPAEKRSHIKENLSQIYGFKFLRIIKYLSDPNPIYRIATDKGSVSGSIDLIVTQNAFRKAMAQATGIVVKSTRAPTWDQNAQAMLSICEDVELGAEATDAGYGSSLIQRYFAEAAEPADEFSEDIGAELRPYKDGNYLLFFSQAFSRFAKLHDGSNMSHQKIGMLLRAAGWRPGQKAFGKGDKRVNLSVWKREMGKQDGQ